MYQPKVDLYPNLQISQEGLISAKEIRAVNEQADVSSLFLVGERPLTVYLDKYEIVTLMTIGTHPELLTLGYLLNQGLLDSLHEVEVVQVDWETDAVTVITNKGARDLRSMLEKRTVTTGCGQGTVFGSLMDKLQQINLDHALLKQSALYDLLTVIRQYNEVYKQAGAVHGCALCEGDQVNVFIEDVGRHNAVDAIAGYMQLHDISGENKIFYTTGRLTSEMVIKVSQMHVPILLSRSGATQMGLDVAQQAGITLVARAKGKGFQVLNGADKIVFDAKPSIPHQSSRRNK